MQGTRAAYHLRVRDHSTLDDHLWLRTEVRGGPHDQVGQFPNFDASEHVAHALSNGGIDCVLADVSLDAEVVGACTFILLQYAPLQLVLVSRVPRSEDNFATTTHGLGVGRHHADGPEVMEDIFGGDCFRADPRLRKRHVFRDVLGQMMTDHEHVKVLV